MSQEKKAKKNASKKVKKDKKGIDAAIVIIIIGLIIIAIPFAFLGYILISDSMKTGTPITGDRFLNDLNPAITEDDQSRIVSAVGSLSNVESCEVILKTATLRVYVDAEDGLDNEALNSLATEAYDTVTGILNPSVYFTQHDGMKMYDIEIHVYNLKENRDSDAFGYVIANKSSSMEEAIIQVVSEAKDPELAQQLRDSLETEESPTPAPDDEGDITVGGEEQENVEDDGE